MSICIGDVILFSTPPLFGLRNSRIFHKEPVFHKLPSAQFFYLWKVIKFIFVMPPPPLAGDSNFFFNWFVLGTQLN